MRNAKKSSVVSVVCIFCEKRDLLYNLTILNGSDQIARQCAKAISRIKLEMQLGNETLLRIPTAMDVLGGRYPYHADFMKF